MTETNRSIADRIISFEQNSTGYDIWLLIRGYEMNDHGMLFHEKIPLGTCDESEIDQAMKVFQRCNHNVDIVMKNDVVSVQTERVARLNPIVVATYKELAGALEGEDR